MKIRVVLSGFLTVIVLSGGLCASSEYWIRQWQALTPEQIAGLNAQLDQMGVRAQEKEVLPPVIDAILEEKSIEEINALIALEDVENLVNQKHLDQTALAWAARQGRLDVVQALVDRGMPLFSEGDYLKTALYEAMRHPQVADYLLEKALVNRVSFDYSKFLSRAVQTGNKAIVRKLIQAGAILQNGSPLMKAMEHEKLDMALLLLRRGAGRFVNDRDYNGYTALHWAALRGYDDVARQLLALPGVQVNAQNNNGYTPLMLAARSGNPRLVEMLINAGANKSLRDTEYHKTAYQYALMSQYRHHGAWRDLFQEEDEVVNEPARQFPARAAAQEEDEAFSEE